MYSTPVILVSIFVAICESLWTRVRGISLAAYRFLATISRQIATLPLLPISLSHQAKTSTFGQVFSNQVLQCLLYTRFNLFSQKWAIHSKSAKICGFCFSVSKDLRKKCVNCYNKISRQKCVNQ